MIYKSRLLIPIVATVLALPAQAAILWGPAGPAKTKSSRFNYDRTDEAREVNDFWRKRKMGVGFAAAGTYGLMGMKVSVNWHPQWAVELGYGGGSHFQSFGFGIKKMMLVSSPINPYFGFGFHRWQRNTTRPYNINDVAPGVVVDELLSDADRRTGRIDEKLMHASLGLQYIFTNGAWEGIGVFAEAIVLISAEDFQWAPTASLGATYYF